MDHFKQVWSDYDPEATTFIKIYDLKKFLFTLGKPLGWDDKMAQNHQEQDKFIAQLELPIHHDFQDYMFMEVLESLALRLVIQQQLEIQKDRKKKDKQKRDSLLEISSEEEEESEK